MNKLIINKFSNSMYDYNCYTYINDVLSDKHSFGLFGHEVELIKQIIDNKSTAILYINTDSSKHEISRLLSFIAKESLKNNIQLIWK